LHVLQKVSLLFSNQHNYSILGNSVYSLVIFWGNSNYINTTTPLAA